MTLPEEDYAELRRRAVNNDRSINGEVNHLLKLGLEKSKKSKPLIIEMSKLPTSKVTKIMEIINT